MKGLRQFGDYAFEFIVVTLLLAVSAATVVLFVPAIVGVAGFFQRNIDERRFKDIFLTIKENWKIIIFYAIFQLIIIVFPVFNIYFFNTHPENMNYFVLAISYIALVVGIIYLTTSPTIIVNMNVKFKQLIYNGIMLLFGHLGASLLSLCCVGGVIALILYYPYAVPFTLYIVPLAVTAFMKEGFYRQKAKALNTSVEELKKKEASDDYIDDDGNVVRETEDLTDEESKNENE